MSDVPEQLKDAERVFKIPTPPSLDEGTTLDTESLSQAVAELQGNKAGTLAESARRGKVDWQLKFWLKILLFVF